MESLARSAPAGAVRAALEPLLDGATRVGPARVLAVEAGVPRVELDGEQRPARMALAFSYAPVAGDELLVISARGGCYVIGVLSAQGEMTIEFPGDIHIRSTEGDLRLEALEGIELSSGTIDVKVQKLRVIADIVTESARETYQRIRDVWSVRAGSKQEVIAGEISTRARTASIVTHDTVSVNGRAVHLG